jgi:hypothetical protein
VVSSSLSCNDYELTDFCRAGCAKTRPSTTAGEPHRLVRRKRCADDCPSSLRDHHLKILPCHVFLYVVPCNSYESVTRRPPPSNFRLSRFPAASLHAFKTSSYIRFLRKRILRSTTVISRLAFGSCGHNNVVPRSNDSTRSWIVEVSLSP